MDWAKAKTILIIALLITNVFIGGTYLSKQSEALETRKEAVKNAVAYAGSRGVAINCELPYEEEKLPVLFVSIDRNGSGEASDYKGIPVEAGKNFDGRIIPEGQGDAKGRLIPASNALLRLIEQLGNESEGLEIDSVGIVYWLELTDENNTAAKDTAVPAWKFSGSRGTYYIEAFEQ